MNKKLLAALGRLKGAQKTPVNDLESPIETKKGKGDKKEAAKGEDRKEVEGKKAKAPADSLLQDAAIEKAKSYIKKQKGSVLSRLEELGVDVKSLNKAVESEEGEGSLESEKESSVSEKGHSDKEELDKKGKKRGSKTQPQPGPASYSQADADITEIIEDMPDSAKDLSKGIMSYLNKLQYLALARAEKMLASASVQTDPSELVKLATSLRDMQLTIKYTRKYEQHILNNPSKMTPLGVGGRFRLLERLGSMEKQVRNESKVDQRTTGARNGSAALELPPDDMPASKVGGA